MLKGGGKSRKSWNNGVKSWGFWLVLSVAVCVKHRCVCSVGL